MTALRQAVAQVSPAALPAFTRELDEAAVSQWAAYVHIQRQPRLAEELRRWEQVAS